MTDTKLLREQLDILDVLEKLGARFDTSWGGGWDDEVLVFCPFCEDRDSNNPAGRANVARGVYYCFNCGCGGDVISLARRHLFDETDDDSFKAAVRWLIETFGVDGV